MGLYRYEAVDKTGKVLHGAMDASGEQQVNAKLTAMGYSPRSVYPAGAPPGTQKVPVQQASAAVAAPVARGGAMSVTVASGVPVSIKSSVPAPALARFFRHMATLVRSGIPLGQALNDMVPVIRQPRLRQILSDMRENTTGGRRLSSLMAEHPGVFPVHTTASVWTGELSGRLEVALDEVAADLEQEAADTRFGRIGWGLTKINWIFTVICLPLCNLGQLLTPVLKESLSKGGEQSSAQVITSLAQTYMRQSFWPTILVCLAFGGSWIAWGHMKRMPQIRYKLDALLLYAPFWGRFHRVRARARFLHVLDGLTSSGISPDSAWDAASLTPKNSFIAERLRSARSRLGPNASISQLLAASEMFDAEDIGFLVSGEKSGTVPEVLAHLSQDYQLRIDSMRTTGKTTSTTIMVAVGALLAVIVLALLFKSYGDFAFKAADMMGGQ